MAATTRCLFYCARLLPRVAKQYCVERIYAHFPNHCFLIAAWQAAEYLGLPFTVYLDILWEEGGMCPHLATRYERKVLHRADSRFAITEFAVEHLQNKHGLKVELLPHVVDISNLPLGLSPLLDTGPPVIHYSGAIYPAMNEDALLRMVLATQIARTKPTVAAAASI